MNRKIVLTLTALLALGSYMWADRSIPVKAQEKNRVANYQSSDNAAMKQAEISYAAALLKLAQADLAKVQEANRRVPDTIPNSIVRGLEAQAAEAEGRLKAMQMGNSSELESPYIALAKQGLNAAEQSLKQAMDANARTPDTIPPTEVQRRQAVVELAKARMEMANALKNGSATDVMEWQLLQLLADMQEVRAQVGLLQYRN